MGICNNYLAALGFNIFLYAKEGTDIFSKYFKQGTEKTINTANTGAEFGLDFINNSLSGLYNIFENPELKKHAEDLKKSADKMKKSLDKVIDNLPPDKKKKFDDIQKQIFG